ncbi:cytochrome c-type biogenesis protein CcsB [Mariniflexile fucanivorans]|uniref:Cytochrome c-type biogenesis protein CcsB n=1 Tax=Mariniflexile fucanivorans TaxID=264023 RepID=A0A4R1RN48_9FLAO|nr:cytochrome c biogenesis protein CcsA [Mariniflexile fucanivorans]TCL67718.1 cytochrome c-type biogenesis protein CcsB [Mariniflexile fucanivorans]
MQKLYKFFSSSSLALLLLLVFATAMAIATFVENDYGTATAWVVIYDSWWFELVMLGLVISFIANIFKYKLLRKEKWAILLFHVAFIIIILGSAITRYTSYGGIMRIREGASSNIIISDTNFLNATITDGKTKTILKEKLAFSPIQNNDFSLETTFNNKPIIISYKEFIPDAIAEVVDNDEDGEPLLEMVVTEGEGRNTIYLKHGEIQKFGDHQHEIGFNSEKESIINIVEENGAFSIKSPHDLDFFMMASQQAGTLVKDSLHPINLRTLYRSGDISFVPLSYHEKGAFKIKSTSAKPKDNDKTKDDALLVNVSVNGKEKPLNLLYRQGMLPTHHDIEIDGVRVILSYGAAAIQTPFSIKLNDFQLERYPGSSSPSAYASEVLILDGEDMIPYKIFMNNVLDYKGYRFFQASYDTDELGTVLSVNHDSLGTIVTYIGYLLLTLGMFFALFGKASRFHFINKKLKQLKKPLATLILLLGIQFGFSQNTKDSTAIFVERLVESQKTDKAHADFFGRLLVQDLDGRIKPINTLASEFIRKISRKSNFSYPVKNETLVLDANQVFLAIHMAPNVWQEIPMIKVDFDKTGNVLKDVKIGANTLVSFKSLMDASGNYLLSKEVEEANKKKPAERNEFDKEVLKIDERFNILYNLFIGNYLKIFPNKNDSNNTWFSYIHDFNDFPEEDAKFAQSILPAYFNDVATFKYDDAHEKLMYIKKYQEVLGAEVIPTPERIEAEIWYNKTNVNFWLFQVFFTIGFVLLVIAILKMFSHKKIIELINNTFIILTLISFLCFTANIILRWYVAQHAPWSNGYEMLVFVAWVLLLCGLLTFRKSDFSLPLATLFSGALLFVSYLDWLNPEITNLMPVLKSYWLKIHVATIVSSYAPLALSAVLGLMALILIIFKNPKNKAIIETKVKELSYINEIAMTIGLFVLAIGTFLGGVWANESWGRYWAWDPKETWALISIIVYAIVLHLRFIPKLNNNYVLNVASMFAFWSIIMTSFGVNYYLSGLHSYAAGDPLPIPKFVYVVALLMVVVAIIAYFRNKQMKTE